eukprot:TRINITY_DN115171_c0_g1_i1.p1 TRINITY_DN115171_c0_g1~~TRINITY_DN115171_c0_g1_i1.p1  ORF type:complete len:105 (+),score=5.06 TRINITY_DN115171_c0_g1_i1:53-367(+)
MGNKQGCETYATGMARQCRSNYGCDKLDEAMDCWMSETGMLMQGAYKGPDCDADCASKRVLEWCLEDVCPNFSELRLEGCDKSLERNLDWCAQNCDATHCNAID